MDSSILFLAIVGLVLCYLVPGWLRNRHHASHSRLDDRSSRAMRMITPREVKPSSTSRGLILRDSLADEASGSNLGDLSKISATQGNSCPPSRRSRQLGLLALAALVGLPALAMLASMQVVPWSAVVADALLGAGCLTVLRMRVRRHRRRAPEPAVDPLIVQSPSVHSTTSTRSTPRATDHSRSAGWLSHTASTELQSPRRQSDRRGSAEWQSATVLYDEDAIRTVERAAALAAARAEATEKARIRAELEANLQPGEWLPTDVPKPAYLLKPNAPARRPLASGVIDLRDPSINETEPVADSWTDSDHAWLDEHAPLRRAAGD